MIASGSLNWGIVAVTQPVRKAPAYRIQKQAPGFGGVPGNGDRPGALQSFTSAGLVVVDHSVGGTTFVEFDTRGHAISTDLHTVGQRVGQMGDIWLAFALTLQPCRQ